MSTRDDDCRGELLARDREGQLSRAESLALEAHLERCASCRLARQIFSDFDHSGAVEVHDGARLVRLAEAGRRWGEGQARRSGRARAATRRQALAFAASLVLAGGTASGAVWLWRSPAAVRQGATPGPLAASDPAAPRTRRAPAVSPPALAAVPALPATSALAAPPAAAVVPLEPPGRPVLARLARPHARAGEASGPGALLREAGDARRAGDLPRAVALYGRLQEQFPASPEAVLSAVPLGGLLIDRGLPRAALAQFDAYLGSSRGGALIPEALYGRARALARLGDRPEERRTWERLLADFPDSAYAPRGRSRLAELH
jgi:hypothetical protein